MFIGRRLSLHNDILGLGWAAGWVGGVALIMFLGGLASAELAGPGTIFFSFFCVFYNPFRDTVFCDLYGFGEPFWRALEPFGDPFSDFLDDVSVQFSMLFSERIF